MLLATLRENPIFADAPEDLLAALCAHAQLRAFAAEQPVLSEGEPAQDLFVLVDGVVRAYHSLPSGDELVLKLFRAPAIFGEAEALSGIPFIENVRAVGAAQVIVLPIEDVLAFLERAPRAAARMLADVALRLAITAYHEKTLAFHPATVRLANHLLDHLEATGEDGPSPHLSLTQDQMAAAIGVTRRSIAKDIITWQTEGVLAKDASGGYVVRDLAALRRRADPQRLSLTHAVRSPPRARGTET